MTGLRLVLATANPDKVGEIRAALGPDVELVDRPSAVGEVVEDADTLEGNARLKAQAICEATGEAAVADDTGLTVDALGGAPGVHSARYSGEGATYESNLRKLLADMDGIQPADRTARFTTVALVLFPDGTEVVASGAVAGVIATEPAGTNGFGYDPVFVPTEGDGRTFAEMSDEEKDALSHRGRAFRALRRRLDPRSPVPRVPPSAM